MFYSVSIFMILTGSPLLYSEKKISPISWMKIVVGLINLIKKEPGYEYFIKDNKVCKKRSSNIEKNQSQEETVENENSTELKTCYMCDGEGKGCGTCKNSGNVHCNGCKGYGNIDGKTCRNCGGNGLSLCFDCEGNPGQHDCSICDGSGYTKYKFVDCFGCNGTKTIQTGVGPQVCDVCHGDGGWEAIVSSKD